MVDQHYMSVRLWCEVGSDTRGYGESQVDGVVVCEERVLCCSHQVARRGQCGIDNDSDIHC